MRATSLASNSSVRVSRILLIGLGVTLGAAACATSPQHGRVATAADPPDGERAPGTASRTIPRESLARLSTAVESLAAGTGAIDHDDVVNALRQLANAVELLPGARRRPIEVLRETVQRFETSDLPSPDQAALLKQGLSAALQVLVTRSGFDGLELDFQKAVRAFGEAVETIDKERPLVEQDAKVAAAFRASTNTLFLVAGRQAPFAGEDRNSDATRRISFEGAVQEARAEVLKLGRTDWTQARKTSSSALSAVANVVAAADCRNTLGDKVSNIRLQAERVRYADSLSFGRAAWIKMGLLGALDVLEAVWLTDEQRLSVWRRAARRAVASIEDHHSLAFQRAAIQDAYRATVDAFVAASQTAPACR